MNQEKQFRKYFGLKWSDRLNTLYYRILFVVILIVYTNVFFVANLDYITIKKDLTTEIFERYKRLIKLDPSLFSSQFQESDFVSIKESENDKIKAKAGKDNSTSLRKLFSISDIISEQKTVSTNRKKNNIYDYLPESDETYDTSTERYDLLELSYRSPNGRLILSQGRTNKLVADPGTVKGKIRSPFVYDMKRHGSIYIDVTDELIGDVDYNRGYRDPEEIERVVYKNQPNIQNCYKKEARFLDQLRGFIVVEFRVSYLGNVIPESVRIIESTIRNRKMEQCIKKYIRTWRGFSKQDESQGIALVKQKFIFN